MAENLDQKSLDEIRKNCGHLGARIQCDNCGAFIPTPQELEYWKSKFLTARQLADLLPLDEDTIYRYAKAGTIPRVEIPWIDNDVYFDQKEIEKWLRNLLESPTAPTL